MHAIKEEAIHLIKLLPENCSWDDIIYELYVKKKIELGIKAAKEGRVISHEDVKKRFAKLGSSFGQNPPQTISKQYLIL